MTTVLLLHCALMMQPPTARSHSEITIHVFERISPMRTEPVPGARVKITPERESREIDSGDTDEDGIFKSNRISPKLPDISVHVDATDKGFLYGGYRGKQKEKIQIELERAPCYQPPLNFRECCGPNVCQGSFPAARYYVIERCFDFYPANVPCTYMIIDGCWMPVIPSSVCTYPICEDSYWP